MVLPWIVTVAGPLWRERLTKTYRSGAPRSPGNPHRVKVFAGDFAIANKALIYEFWSRSPLSRGEDEPAP